MQVSAFALFRLGFRPFFLTAVLFSVIVMSIWMLQLVFSIKVLPSDITPMFWHAHEMIYGYALAVVAGFLLTAVRNWTRIQTIHGLPLQLLLLFWVLARIASLIPGPHALIAGVIMDNIFIASLSLAITIPVVRARLWKNMSVVSKIYFLLIGNIIYSLGLLGMFSGGERIGIYIGLYMILSLILVLSRRVMPMFIEGGVGYTVSLKNHLWVDISGFLLFLTFAVSDTFFTTPALTAWLAAALFILHCIRLWGWHTHGIWDKPLLWVLYLAYAWIILGFGLKFVAFIAGIPPSLAVHAFTVGGIGMMTLGMMARVSLGHTGRNIMQPPSGLGPIFFMLFLGAFVRVVFPLMFAGHYLLWIGISQVFWIGAFSLFLYIYAPILIRPRIDGQWG
ncbi:MAG: NnrS family protein [Zetaproteobacteria bacterium]|nr:MAG: NnrS family protein [Zetaproteobacteria bacterium]